MNASIVADLQRIRGRNTPVGVIVMMILTMCSMLAVGCEQSSPAPSATSSPGTAPPSAASRPVSPSSPSPPAAGVSVEDEVLANLLKQQIGRQTLAAYNLPEAFLRREADRIIRSTFEERSRIVVMDQLAKTADGQAAAPEVSLERHAASGAIDIVEPPLTAETLAHRRSLPRGHPPNRGYMPTLHDGDALWPLQQPDDSASESLRDAADHVGLHLASDGVLLTLANALRILGPERFTTVEANDLAMLRATGLPIDLLQHFTLVDGANDTAIIAAFAQAMSEGVAIQAAAMTAVRELINRANFAFVPTQPGFEVADDAGSVEPGAIRTQVTRGGYWRGIGDGGTTDLIRQAMAALPGVPFIASVEVKQARGFAEIAATWPLQMERQLVLVIEPMEVQQWTQDNAKAGTVDANRLGMIVPRYASWGDDGSTFLPDQTFLLAGAAAALGAQLIHSPLLFQGGNILCVQSPGTGERLLLVSDADVYRNTALGLNVPQALEAMRVEFGCDRCEMLEAVSFHLDYDISVRVVGDRTIALVNDPMAAAVIVAEQGVNVLAQAGLLDANAASKARSALSKGGYRAFLDVIGPVVYSIGANGRFPLSLAERFSTSPMDSGVGNLHRFLLAMDLIVTRGVWPGQFPSDRHARSYLTSLLRRDGEREALHQRLRALGMEVVAVPSMADATRSIAALNGLQLRGLYLMPSYGGLYSPVDAAAQETVRKALGDGVRIVPIECSESQRRSGAVRCSLSVFPRLTRE